MDNKSKYPTIYWGEYSDSIINKYNLKQTVKGEYHGSCPACGGTDRFWIKEHQGLVKWFCRQCDDFKQIKEEMQHDGVLPTEQEAERWEPVAVNDLSDFKKIEPYHIRKGIDLHGAVQVGSDIVVPIVDITGKRVNQQTITPDGKKKFKQGAPVEGNFLVVGGKLTGVCYLAEGFATACSVAQSTSRPAVFTLNSGNLVKVAKLLQEARPECRFIVAADNDEAGIKAAKETGLPYRAPRETGADWNDIMLKHGNLAVEKELKRVRMPKPLFMPLGELDFKAPEWLIDGLIETNTFAVCFGSPAAGKTFLVLDMALSIATGQKFFDHDVKQGAVFYIAGEGHNGFARRAAAWSKDRQTSLKGVPFFKSSRAIIMTEDSGVTELLDTIDAMVQEHGEPQLIVIDTLARSMGAADENSTKDMGAMIRAVDDVRDAYDCTVLAVHHTGHSSAAKDRARGSSALLGAVDAEFKVEKWGDDANNKVEVKFTKMKDAMTPEPMNFLHRQVEIIGSDLQTSTSIVLDICQDSRPKFADKRLTGHKKRFMDAFNEARGTDSQIPIENVRTLFEKSLVQVSDLKSDNYARTFQRTFQECQDAELISSDETMVYAKSDKSDI